MPVQVLKAESKRESRKTQLDFVVAELYILKQSGSRFCKTVSLSVCFGRRPQATNPGGLLPSSQTYIMSAAIISRKNRT